jgi:hypothetical protein
MRPTANARYKVLGSELCEMRFRSPGATSFYKRESVRAVRRVDSVADDLAAIDHLHWTVAQDIAMDPAEYDCECASCEGVAEVYRRYYRIAAHRLCDRAPLRAPLAEIARAA